jgi:LPS-assembly lipoprotein
MSWRESRFPSRRMALAAAFLLPLATAGCIHPLYGPSPSGGTVQNDLAAIVIDKVPDRFGHYLVQELGFDLDGSGTGSVTPRYRLSIKTTETVSGSIVSTLNGTATLATIYGTAAFKLTPIDSDEPVLLTDSAAATASYNRNEQRFASVRAARDAEIRVAEQLAEQIRNRIAAKFATAPKKT